MRNVRDDFQTSMRWLVALLIMAGVGVLAPNTARAQQVDGNNEISFDRGKKNEFYIAPRMRAIVVPDWLLGAFYEEHASHWDDGPNLAYGLEFVWRKVDAYEISTAIEYADLSMPSQFWLENDDPANNADYTEVDLQLLSLVVSGYWYWDAQKWVSPYVGGGIGLGVVMGEIVRYDAASGSACEASLGGSDGFASDDCFGPDGEPHPNSIDQSSRKVEESVPPVIPVLNVTGGLRFNIGEHAIAKLEVGFYDYFFGGVSLGGQW
ncbi:hypothetical protein [Bradymonas sediminis]|nr:hypothetical protein [Bradymonas sediminis]TDP63695.1 hypothetical protein DFR33_110153 [Bradymonas sediminis]